MNRSDDKEYWAQRFSVPQRLREFKSRYDMPSEEIQDLVGRRPKPFTKYEIDLTTARAATDAFVIASVGRAFQVGFYTTTDTAKVPLTSQLVEIRVNENLSELEFDGRHGTGYRGDFEKLYLSWAAQSGVTLQLIVFHFDETPWMNFDGIITGSVTAASPKIIDGTAFTRTVTTLVAATATSVLAVSTSRIVDTIQNNTGAVLYVGETGITDAGATQGYQVAAGASFQWRNGAALFCYSTAGGNITVLKET